MGIPVPPLKTSFSLKNRSLESMTFLVKNGPFSGDIGEFLGVVLLMVLKSG